MALIEWKDEFATGVPDVDSEHRQLIDLINALHVAVTREDVNYTVMDFLGQIYARISGHFALEEKIMRERRYDQYEDHKTDHERLLDELRDIMDDYEEHAYYSDEEFTRVIESWFTQHFKTRDARLHKHLA
jgi:hemerythrin-like metal-binding protein